MRQKIGIWGLGVVGKSVVKHVANHNCLLQVTDKRHPSEEEAQLLYKHNATYVPYENLVEFLEHNDIIIPSPGIDLRPYSQFAHKWVTELDLFYKAWHKPIIAVTGTIGKTSIVHLLTKILEHYEIKPATGGNIGLGMLDLISHKENYDTALLELSSFQLEHTTTFTPDIAVWTNLYPNHLDRHGSLEDYFNAKYKLIARQQVDQQALINWQLASDVLAQKESSERSFSFFCSTEVTDQELASLRSQDILYRLNDKQQVLKHTFTGQQVLFDTSHLPPLSYKANWLILIALCDMLFLSLEKLITLTNLDIPPHRLSLVATRNGVQFYNDSKSTIPQATLAAVDQLHHAPIHLLLGGVSKGVDRKPLIAQLCNKVATIACFGGEAQELYNECIAQGIPASAHTTLEEACTTCIKNAQSGDIILLSPAGASFDLFKNYQERGERFEHIVKSLLTITS